MSQVVVSLFDYSDHSVEPWAVAGHTCYRVDVQHPAGQTWMGNVCLIGGDVRLFTPPPGPIAFIAAFPPWTDLSNAGAHLFRVKGLRALATALDLVARPPTSANAWAHPTSSKTPGASCATTGGSPSTGSVPVNTPAGSSIPRMRPTPSTPAGGPATASGCRRNAPFPPFMAPWSTRCPAQKTALISAASPREDLPPLYSPTTTEQP